MIKFHYIHVLCREEFLMVYFEIISNLMRNYRNTKKVTHNLHSHLSIINTMLHFHYSLSLSHTITHRYTPTYTYHFESLKNRCLHPWLLQYIFLNITIIFTTTIQLSKSENLPLIQFYYTIYITCSNFANYLNKCH